jgi:hypothetical protein
MFDSPLLAQPLRASPSPQLAPAPSLATSKAPKPPRPAPAADALAAPAPADTSISEAYRACKKAGRVHFKKNLKAGDTLFFHNTRDANGDGRHNDWYTYSARVEQVAPDGAAALLGPDGKRHTIDLKHPKDTSKNSRLRQPQANDPPYTLYSTAELWAGTCAAP